MSNADPRGQFVWHELLTGDAGAAAAFYTKVVPWKTQPWENDPSYSMWVAKNGPVGGIASLGESAAPKWLAYVGVSDVGATLDSAKSLGGRVLKGTTEIPNGGVYALLADPQGAEFGIYKSSQPSNGASPGGAGEFTWHELATSDVKAAMEFYTKLFGWEVGPVYDMGGSAGSYHLFLRGGAQYGGMYTNTDAGGPGWLCYIGVEDAGKAANAVKSAGGRILNGPMEVPGGSWVATALDPEGVAFAVQEAAKAAAARPAEAPAAAKPKSSITKPPKAAKAGGAASSITKPPQAVGGGAASSITKPPQKKSSITKPPKAAAKKASKKASKKAPARKAGRKAAKGKTVAKKAAGKKKSAAKRAPAKKKVSRAKAKKHR